MINFWRVIEPLKTRIKMILNRAILEAIDDSKNIQLLKVSIMEGETKDQIENIQQYGFTSVPKKGSEVLMGFINGNKEQGIALKVGDSRVRLKGLGSGEVAMYHESGTYIKLKSNGTVEISSSGDLSLLDGVVTGQCLCAFTGLPHPDKSLKVFASKS